MRDGSRLILPVNICALVNLKIPRATRRGRVHAEMIERKTRSPVIVRAVTRKYFLRINGRTCTRVRDAMLIIAVR